MAVMTIWPANQKSVIAQLDGKINMCLGLSLDFFDLFISFLPLLEIALLLIAALETLSGPLRRVTFHLAPGPSGFRFPLFF